jgi:O-6-methylguanine DNA methyltransferase
MLRILGHNGKITCLLLPGSAPEKEALPTVDDSCQGIVEKASCQLSAYFSGELRSFSLDLEPQGSPFQLQVWQAILRIPYGQTRSYKDIAVEIGSPRASRAVGQAASANPIPILIPCHRVVGSRGELGGYSGGREVKEVLLALESSVTQAAG